MLGVAPGQLVAPQVAATRARFCYCRSAGCSEAGGRPGTLLAHALRPKRAAALQKALACALAAAASQGPG